MGVQTLAVMHINPALAHQRAHAAAFAAGFRRHAMTVEITDDPSQPADIHICSGPHWALSRWRVHPRVILLDRAWWGDDVGNVSLRWLVRGVSQYVAGDESRWQRSGVKLMPLRTADDKRILLGEYNGVYQKTFVRLHGITAFRPHPQSTAPNPDLPVAGGALW